MKKYFAFIFLLFPQLMLAQTGGIGADHRLRAGDELSREVVVFDGSKAEPVIHYTLIQNAEARTVTISYDLDASATVRCVLADSKGVVYRTAEQTNAAGTGYSLALSYSGLPHGQYVVYISAGGLTQAVKFNAQ